MHRVGQVIDDRYVLIRSLGTHGGAAMWEAEHRQVGRKVTLKLLASGGGDPLAQDKLLAEARAAALIGHTTAVEVFDVGVTGSAYYLVTEPLSGELLVDALARLGRLTVEDACEIAIAILDGLDAAHHAGIVHGEIRPSKIILRRDTGGGLAVKVLDYRAAVVRSGVKPIGSSVPAADPDGAPPEEPEPREEPDSPKRSEPFVDLAAVAALLREMIAGERTPDRSADVPEGADAPRAAIELPEALARALDRARPDSPARFANAREMASALAPFVATPHAPSLTPRNSQAPFLSPDARRSRGLARLERVVHAMSGSPPRIAVGGRPKVYVVDTSSPAGADGSGLPGQGARPLWHNSDRSSQPEQGGARPLWASSHKPWAEPADAPLVPAERLTPDDLVSPKIPGPPRAPRHVGVESHRAARSGRKGQSGASAAAARRSSADEPPDPPAPRAEHGQGKLEPSGLRFSATQWNWSLVVLAIGGVVLGLTLAHLLHW